MRNIVAYLIGASLFLLAIPYGLYHLASLTTLAIVPNRAIASCLALPFAISGLWLMWHSNRDMVRIGKGNPVDGFNVAIGERTAHLMTAGVYRLCRNPMLLGTIAFYTAIALLLNRWLSLAAVGGFAVYMYWHIQQFEEPRLLRDFGDAYRAYCQTTPRLLPHWRTIWAAVIKKPEP